MGGLLLPTIHGMELETQGLLASIILQICTSNRTCTWRRQIIRAQYDFVSHCNILNNDFTSYNKHYYGCPDDKTFQHMASVYSRSHYNMSLSKEFEGGITNGAFWYPIYGGMQDWNYIHGGCFELTLEISDTKWPKADELPIIWEHSRMSMLNLLASLIKAIERRGTPCHLQ
ncbi:Carboxypeptidase SOL1 [Zea mays]|uniref:Carboxypeptidase SOL1 n=2 Tax=Zea mays TaxID=4577 RepID=A0A1D6KJB8_MAIZE|nr:Carboxypeptidase SOL1 [Zea mays]ONM03036.1 Carboxypeptidase SOL1 [Zea mays]